MRARSRSSAATFLGLGDSVGEDCAEDSERRASDSGVAFCCRFHHHSRNLRTPVTWSSEKDYHMKYGVFVDTPGNNNVKYAALAV